MAHHQSVAGEGEETIQLARSKQISRRMNKSSMESSPNPHPQIVKVHQHTGPGDGQPHVRRIEIFKAGGPPKIISLRELPRVGDYDMVSSAGDILSEYLSKRK